MMSRLSTWLIVVVIATFFGFFLAEALLWTVPFANGILLPQLDPGLTVPAVVQVRVLTALFRNQGVYNLMMALGGVWGLRLAGTDRREAGATLLRFLCMFAIGAALTLLATTHAYLLGAIQLVFPVAALASMPRGSTLAAEPGRWEVSRR